MFEGSNDSTADSKVAGAAPQPEYRISLTLSVSDANALWTAAATRLLAAPGMTRDDVVDVIGPRQDPSILDCLTAIVSPGAVAGCLLDDFWIDGLKGCPPRLETVPVRADAGSGDRPPSNDQPMRRMLVPRKLYPTLHVSR